MPSPWYGVMNTPWQSPPTRARGPVRGPRGSPAPGQQGGGAIPFGPGNPLWGQIGGLLRGGAQSGTRVPSTPGMGSAPGTTQPGALPYAGRAPQGAPLGVQGLTGAGGAPGGDQMSGDPSNVMTPVGPGLGYAGSIGKGLMGNRLVQGPLSTPQFGSIPGQGANTRRLF